MNRSDKGRWWYLAYKTLRFQEIWLPILGFAISFVWIGHALSQYQSLFKTLQKPAVLHAELQQNLQEDLRLSIQATEGVEALTVYTEDSAVMQWEDYSGEVPVYYVESDYIRWLAGQSDSNQMPFSEGMPYAVVSEKALENLTRKKQDQQVVISADAESEMSETSTGNKNTKADQLLLSENDLMQDFTLNEDKTVRLYGLIQNEEMPGVYLSDEWQDDADRTFFSHTGGDIEDVSKSDKEVNQETNNEVPETLESGSQSDTNGAEKTSVKLLIAVKNGFDVPSVIKKLSTYQAEAKSDVTDEILQTNEKNLSLLEMGGIILVCAIFMMLTGERIWKVTHKKWLEDIRCFAMQPNGDKKVVRRRRLMIIGLGWMGSFLWQWLSALYGWL